MNWIVAILLVAPLLLRCYSGRQGRNGQRPGPYVFRRFPATTCARTATTALSEQASDVATCTQDDGRADADDTTCDAMRTWDSDVTFPSGTSGCTAEHSRTPGPSSPRILPSLTVARVLDRAWVPLAALPLHSLTIRIC